MKEKSISEESIKLSKLLQTKPTSDHKLAYYKNLLFNNEDLYASIQKRIKKGTVTTINWVFGFIPIITNKKLDDLAIARLNHELIEVENTTFNNKNYYEQWTAHNKRLEKTEDEIIRECNQNFDKMLEEAKAINGNLILNVLIDNYKNENNDQTKKYQFYLNLKQHVNNNKVYGNMIKKVK